MKAEGILSTGDDGGLRVRVLAYNDIHTLYELRAELESMAAGLAATHASPAEREFIADIRTKEAALVDKGASPVALAKLNGQFHQSIALASDNPFLIEALQRLSTLMILLGQPPTAYPPVFVKLAPSMMRSTMPFRAVTQQQLDKQRKPTCKMR